MATLTKVKGPAEAMGCDVWQMPDQWTDKTALSLVEAANLMGVSRQAVNYLVNVDRLPARWGQNRWEVSAMAVYDYIEQRVGRPKNGRKSERT